MAIVDLKENFFPNGFFVLEVEVSQRSKAEKVTRSGLFALKINL
jgi:hypothetical protein